MEDPEEVEKHAKKLEYSTKSPKKLARLSEELKNPSSNCLSRLWRSKKENFFVKVLKQKLKQRLKQKKLLTKLTRLSLKKPSSNCLSRLWRPKRSRTKLTRLSRI